jgi:hypothetical protein
VVRKDKRTALMEMVLGDFKKGVNESRNRK